MEKNLYIDASHPNETRVVLKSDDNIEDYEYEGLKNNLIKNNIYLGKVSRIEPSLQAAFIDFGRERHGFLSFNDIQSDYYQIPKADLDRIKEEEEKAREELSKEVEAKEEENIAEGKLEIDDPINIEKESSEEVDGEADEKRMSIGLMHTSYLSEDLKLTLIGEYMDIEKLGGEKGHDRTYTTYGFNLQHGKFTLGGTLTYKDNDATEADENVDDNVRQISLGYYVEENFKVDIGYKRKKVSNEVSEIGGITLYYVFDWPSGGHDHHDH